MPNPTPNAFVSAYKHYRVMLDTMTDAWIVYTRQTRVLIGKIMWNGKCWVFHPEKINFEHTQLLDIAACIKAVEKRGSTPTLYQ